MGQEDILEHELNQDEMQVVAGSGNNNNSTAIAIGAVGAGLVGTKLLKFKIFKDVHRYGLGIRDVRAEEASRTAAREGGGAAGAANGAQPPPSPRFRRM